LPPGTNPELGNVEHVTCVIGPKAGDIGGKLLSLASAFRVNVVFDGKAKRRAVLEKLRPCFGVAG
jgi:hypothetical protein